MRLEAVRAMDGLADGCVDSQGTEEAVRHADSERTARGTPIADDRGERPRRRLCGQPGRTAASVRRAIGLADGRSGNTAVRQVVSYADGQADGHRTVRRTGEHTSTSRNGHLQHRDPKPPPSAGRSGSYPGVKFTKSGFQRTSPPSGGRRTSGTSDVLTTLSVNYTVWW